jgi:hypothetical protein
MITVRRYEPGDAEQWDRFCADSWQGTFLHTRRFLSYHGDRFVDRSLLIEEAGRVVGLFPAAEWAGGISSHPGLTYGGVVQAGGLRGERMIEALEAISRHYAGGGILRYKAVPALYHRVPAEDDLYALFRLGARRVRCDLSCTIDLARRGRIAERRRRGWRKSQTAGVVVSEEISRLDRFWEVVESNLARRHEARPVHTLEEMVRLVRLFPTAIRLLVATVGDEVIAGSLLFITPTTVHTQYIAASDEGFRLAALDAVFTEAIEFASRLGCRWFDFGTSNEQDGQFLNHGLYTFKSEFGGGGRVYETYELDLMT